MNILFVNFHEPAENSGGIETITGILSAEFQRHFETKVYCLWKLPRKDNATAYNFTVSRQIPETIDELSSIINAWAIDFIVVQAYNETVSLMRKAISLSGRHVKLLYVLHSMPGWEKYVITLERVKMMTKTQGLRGWLKYISFPLFHYLYFRRLHRTYNKIYSDVDAVVLLSPRYIDQFSQEYHIEDTSKLRAVPNCNPIETDYYNYTSDSKSKTVLIVSRLSEYDKNLSQALKIWEEIEKIPELTEWRLVIVGDGIDRTKYEQIIEQNKLHRVDMVGQCSPIKYYMSSAIFMMTSRFEGFGLTLVEGQTFGCVPIVYNSFGASLDIIDNYKNGILIENNNINQYVEALKSLMLDAEKRIEMSLIAMDEVKKFSRENIVKQWLSMFSEL